MAAIPLGGGSDPKPPDAGLQSTQSIDGFRGKANADPSPGGGGGGRCPEPIIPDPCGRGGGEGLDGTGERAVDGAAAAEEAGAEEALPVGGVAGRAFLLPNDPPGGGSSLPAGKRLLAFPPYLPL